MAEDLYLIKGETLTGIAEALRSGLGDIGPIQGDELEARALEVVALIGTGTGGSEVEIDIQPELDLAAAYLIEMVNAYGVEMPAAYSLTVGETYRVVWDAKTHVCVAQDASGFIPGAIALGNCTELGLSGNNEPFIIGVLDGAAMFISTTDTAPGGEHSVRIYQKVEDLADGTYLQTEDGGLILAEGVGGGSSEDVRYVTFMSHDGAVELGKKAVAVGDDCADPIARGVFATPTRESSAQYDYTFAGWATSANGAWDESALDAVSEDRTVYAAYASVVRYYTISYYDGDTLLKSETLAYGSMPEYTAYKSGKTFDRWEPELSAVTGDANYVAQWAGVAAFSDASWDEIAAITEAGDAPDFYNIGDEKEVEITYDDGTTESVIMQIAAFDAQELDGGTAGITLVAKHLLLEKIAIAPGDYKTYYLSDMSEWLNETLYPALPDDLQPHIKEKKVYKYGSSAAETRKCWIPSCTELGASCPVTVSQYTPEGNAYPLFSTDESRIRTLGADGEAERYWTRTHSSDPSTGTYKYIPILATGAPSGTTFGAANKFGVLLAFCI